MPDFFDYYAINPVAVVDQNLWDDKIPEVAMQFQRGPTIYTPLIDWTDASAQSGAQYTIFTELLDGDVNNDEIALDAQYVPEALGVDSRSRRITVARYADKVQLNETSNIFQRWRMSGGRDWRPLLRGLLGENVRRKVEVLARNAYLKGPKDFWTYGGGAANFAQLDASCKFDPAIINEWNLRLGNTGTPIIPGDVASIKQCIIPPGVIYDFQEALPAATKNETAMFRDATILGQGQQMAYQIGTYKNTRFVEVPNDKYGQNSAVLYNAGTIEVQGVVSSAINMGDGAPDPETTKVDDTWYVGQKGVTHYIQLGASDGAGNPIDMSKFAKNDIVTIHTVRTSVYGVTNGVDPLSGKTIYRRIVSVDAGNKRLAFDRPVMSKYAVDLDSGGGVAYAYVTKGMHVGFCLALGSRGGIKGNVNRPLKFYEPKPIDDFESVWRYVWDIIAGYNIWEPNLFEPHFVAVTLPKPGGIISPDTLGS